MITSITSAPVFMFSTFLAEAQLTHFSGCSRNDAFSVRTPIIQISEGLLTQGSVFIRQKMVRPRLSSDLNLRGSILRPAYNDQDSAIQLSTLSSTIIHAMKFATVN